MYTVHCVRCTLNSGQVYVFCTVYKVFTGSCILYSVQVYLLVNVYCMQVYLSQFHFLQIKPRTQLFIHKSFNLLLFNLGWEF